jgi:hypothetical protein
MYLHATILKVSDGWLSDHDIFKLVEGFGWEGSPATLARERRVLSARGLMDGRTFQNEHNNGTHKRHRRARIKRVRK